MLATSLTSSLTSAITSFIGDNGVYAVFLLMLIDAVFPAASELVMAYAGALAAGAFARQEVVVVGERVADPVWALVVVALAGTLGYQLGSVLGWAIGLYGGRPLLQRHGRWLHLSPERLARAERWFDRFGGWAVLVGRLTPVARSFISIPAGVFRSPFLGYNLLTLVGSAAWCFAFAGAGYGLGAGYERLDRSFRYVEYAVVALAVALGALLVLRRRSSRLAERAEHSSR
ncbi:MAG: DedA family protein [Thermoleophilia bacterium]